MPRYVILRHDVPAGGKRPSHWDFMLEHGEVLRTWALERSPDAAESQPALSLPDHRAAYLAYEGPVSGNRGEVIRWDEGTFSTPDDLAGDRIECRLSGRRLRGSVVLMLSPAPSMVREASMRESTYDYCYRADE